MASAINPRNIQYIFGLSICSRLVVLAIQFISNISIADHYADAYRNKYHQVLSANRSMELMLPGAYQYLYNSIQGLTKWDAQYFLEISNDGYVSEQHLAFLPLYPITISIVKQILFEHTRLNFEHLIPSKKLHFEDEAISIKSLENYILAAVVGTTINNFILFPIACLSLFALTKLVKSNSDRYAKNVIWWFCFNPASIFFSSCYSESLFAALTFTAMFMIESRSNSYLSSHQNLSKTTKRDEFVPLNNLNRLIYITLPCLSPLALASATRSNGLANIGFLFFQFLLKYIPMLRLNRFSWSIMAYISVILEFIQDVLVLIMSSMVAASGYLTFQIYSYIKICVQDSSQTKGVIKSRPEGCDNWIPHPYVQIQAKYWNVGLFRYYEVKQLPNFLLALPMTHLVLIGSLYSLKDVVRNRNAQKQLAFYVQAIFMTLLCSVSINIQVITRLLASSCPVIYWICADMAERSRKMNRILSSFFITYLVLGTTLHCNFFPWT